LLFGSLILKRFINLRYIPGISIKATIITFIIVRAKAAAGIAAGGFITSGQLFVICLVFIFGALQWEQMQGRPFSAAIRERWLIKRLMARYFLFFYQRVFTNDK